MRCDWCGRRLKNPATPYEGFALGPVCLRRVKAMGSILFPLDTAARELTTASEPLSEPGSLPGSDAEKPLDADELAFVRMELDTIREFERRAGRVSSPADHVASRLLATLDFVLQHPEGTEC